MNKSKTREEKGEAEEKVSERRAPLTQAAPGAPDGVFQSPGNLFSAILSRNEAVKDAKRLKDFVELRDKYVRQKVLFKDPLFPADDSSLYYSQKFSLNLVWKRPSVSGPCFLGGGKCPNDLQFSYISLLFILALCSGLNNPVINNHSPFHRTDS